MTRLLHNMMTGVLERAQLYPALYTGSMPTRMPPHAYADCTGCLRPRFLILGAYAGFFVG